MYSLTDTYRKKPVVVKARRVPENPDQLHVDFAQWLFRETGDAGKRRWSIHFDRIRMMTIDGNMAIAEPGDWVVIGVHGELYPCKDDIFKKTYEVAKPGKRPLPMPDKLPMGNTEVQVFEYLAEAYLHDGNCYPFNALALNLGLTRRQVKRACRRLARRGLAECVNGLFNDDGETAGSGYCCTPAGHSYYQDVIDSLTEE